MPKLPYKEDAVLDLGGVELGAGDLELGRRERAIATVLDEQLAEKENGAGGKGKAAGPNKERIKK